MNYRDYVHIVSAQTQWLRQSCIPPNIKKYQTVSAIGLENKQTVLCKPNLWCPFRIEHHKNKSYIKWSAMFTTHCNNSKGMYGDSVPGQVYHVTILCRSSQITPYIRMSTGAAVSSSRIILLILKAFRNDASY